MKKWYYITTVERASGWQRWYVEAETLEEAKEKEALGNGEFDSEEVEVMSLGPAEWEADV